MNMKKFLAGLLTVALVMAPMAAMASSTSVEVDGDATYVETTKYVVTLPTTSALEFNLDPTGVYGYFKENGGTTVTTGDLTDYAGKIVGTGYDKIINKSSVDVVVTCDYKLTSTASALNVVTSGDAAVTVTGNDVLLKIIGGTLSGGNYSVTDGDPETPVGTTSSKAYVGLKAVDYQFQLSGGDLSGGEILYVPVNDADENVAALSIGGKLSKEGDWSALDGASNFLKLSCVYSFKGAKTLDGATIKNGFISSDVNAIEYLDAAVGDGGDEGYSVTASSNVVTISELVGTTVRSAVLTRTDASTMNLTAGNHFTVTNAAAGEVTVKQALIENNASAKITLTLATGDTVDIQFE